MGRKRTSGLYQRNGIWHIDKEIFGCRICESTKTASLAEAEQVLARRIEDMRQAKYFGVRPKITFDDAAKQYVKFNKTKQTIERDIQELNRMHRYFANQSLEAIHMGSLQRFIEDRKKDGVKNRTINYGLQVIRHLLNQAATEWLDENGTPWLNRLTKIKLLSEHDKRPPRPITWEEQDRLFAVLPPLLKEMALFAVNTGCRDQEICQLQWAWEIPIPELNTGVFQLPGWYHDDQSKLIKFTKTGEPRLVILNDIARAIVERQRGRNEQYVFAHRFRGAWQRMSSIDTNGWKLNRAKVGLSDVRVHDLRHTFGRRLRAADVSFEDRQDLLGHKSSRMTTHYSAAEVKNLVDAANKICQRKNSSPLLVAVPQKPRIEIGVGNEEGSNYLIIDGPSAT